MKYFGIHKKALRISGISIDGYKNIAYKIYSVIIVLGFMIMYTMCDFFELLKVDSASAFSDVFLYASGGMSAVCKAVVMITRRVKFGRVLNRLQEKPFLPDPNRGGEEEARIVKECLWVTSMQTYTYWILATGTVITSVSISMVKGIGDNNYRDFPYGSFTLLNITSSFNYQISRIYQVVSVSAFANAFVSVDLLICAALVHISYQFKVLQNFLNQMVEVSYKRMIGNSGLQDSEKEIDASAISWKYLHEAIKTAVDYHVAILNIASEIEIAFSELLLIAFLETLSMICMCIYHMAMATSFMNLVRYVGEITTSALQVALYCYWGERVTQESRNVGFAAYESNFPGTDLRFQKALGLIIRRSQTPTVITAGGFTDIGLPTFFWILRTSYSAFMVIRNSASNQQN